MCADGSGTGFAVNPLSTGNGKVLIFLDGGGMCADKSTCTGPFKTATHFNYGASTFTSEMTSSSSKSEVVNLAPFQRIVHLVQDDGGPRDLRSHGELEPVP